MRDCDAKWVRDSGVLQEVNRLLLHRLGLALAVRKEKGESDDNAAFVMLDKSEDLQGFAFEFEDAEDLSDAQRKAADISDWLANRDKHRIEALGYTVQPIPERLEGTR